MYENITVENIIDDMLNEVSNDIDKREGSLIYTAVAPIAIKIKEMYIQMDVILDETFANSASREYLKKRAEERGLEPYPATKAILKGVFNISVPIGARFSLGSLNYEVTEKIADYEYKLECETVGTVGNGNFGSIIPIEYIEGLTSAELTELIIPGEDEEDTEVFRNRYIDSLATEAFGGNKEDYRVKVNALQGVGGVKVHPAWNGGGTVKIEFINSDYDSPSTALIDEVQTAIDPVVNAGEGVGIAPIGHVVTVVGANEDTIDIVLSITYDTANNYDWAAIESYVYAVIDNYFLELKQAWEDSESLIVNKSQLIIRVMELQGVIDVSEVTINENASNYTVNGVPIRGDVSG